MNRQEVENRSILIALTGSRGYGLSTETSDYDYRGVFIAPQPYYLGLLKIEQKDTGWETEPGNFSFLGKDTCIYELRKYLELCIANNPNSLELLWAKNYGHLTPVGEELIKHRHLFLTKKVRSSYSGYGYAQIKRLESHRRWLLNPPSHKPTPQEFGLVDQAPLTISTMNAFLEYLYLLIRDKVQFLEEAEELYNLLTAEIDFKAILKQYELPTETLEYTQKLTHSSGDFIQLLQKSQLYHRACRDYDNYQQWKKNRNPARAKMEAEVGYDCKYAMQAIRLLKTGIEILTHQTVMVDRTEAGDAPQLLTIKRGEFSYEAVMDLANSLYEGLETAYQRSSLPKSVDLAAVNDLCMDLVTRQGW